MKLHEIVLDHPFTIDGFQYTKLTFTRRPTAGDLLAAAVETGSEEETEFNLICNLCGLSPKVGRQIDVKDYYQLLEILRSFLS